MGRVEDKTGEMLYIYENYTKFCSFSVYTDLNYALEGRREGSTFQTANECD